MHLSTGTFVEMVNENEAIVETGGGHSSQYFVRVLSTLNREDLKANTRVALHKSTSAVVDILPPDMDAAVSKLMATEKPDVTYADIGGLDIQKQEIKEAIELPLSHPQLYT